MPFKNLGSIGLRQEMTRKRLILKEFKKKIEEPKLYSITKKATKTKFHHLLSLIWTRSRYMPGCNKTLAEKGNKTVSIAKE